MGWRDDDQDFFNEVSNGGTRAPAAGPCTLCQMMCPRCSIPMHQHTQAGLIECAWRGHPCTNCGHPPHPDNAPGRCTSYTHPGDTPRERGLRLMSAWTQDAKGPFYTYRHCNARHHGRPEPDDPRRVYILAGRVAKRGPGEDVMRQKAAGQVTEFRASPGYPGGPG